MGLRANALDEISRLSLHLLRPQLAQQLDGLYNHIIVCVCEDIGTACNMDNEKEEDTGRRCKRINW